MNTRFYEFGPFQIDKLNHLMLRNGETVPLKPKVFDTLLLLVENRGRVLDKDEMLGRLWPDTVVEESNLSQNIYLLRKVLGEGADGEPYIETLPKRGYRFVASVNEVEVDGHAPEPSERPLKDIAGAAPIQARRASRRPVAVAIFGFLLLLATGSGFYVWKTRNSRPSDSSAEIRSVAVLPFRSLGPDARDESLGFRMADTLITRLSNFKQLRISQTSSVRKFTSSNDDPLAAGRELNVDAVVDASIQSAGERIRINLRLVDVRDGNAFWSGTVEKNADDPFAVQDAVAAVVEQALMPHISGAAEAVPAKRQTTNSEAHLLCMLGRFHLGTANEADWKKAIDYFNAAIAKDPRYALAYSGLANAYLSLVADSKLPKTEAVPKATQAAMTALQLDDTLAEAHVASGRILTYYDWDWAGAEREFKRAIELNGNSGDAHREYAAYLTSVGRNEEAIAEAKQARELDPLTQGTNFQVAWTLIGARRYDEAIAEARQVLKMYPIANYWIGMAHIGKGMNEQAIEDCEKALSSSTTHPAKATLGYAYGATNKQDKAKQLLAEFEELFKQQKASPYFIAMIYAGLGDKDQTFAWLDKAYYERSRPLVSGINANPMWDALRSDPRFMKLQQRMRLPH